MPLEKYTQVNVNLTDQDATWVDQMMLEDGFDNRSAFIRRLVRSEYSRRYAQITQTMIKNLEEQGK
jgi:Arc/MetJ-type ribon-helix-helix transcriptional regulator